MKNTFGSVAEDILMHYGVKRRSGRYPWGSGENPYQHSGDFLARVEELRNQGLNEKDICEALGMTSTDLRMQERVAKHERRELEVARAKSLREDGLNPSEIARVMGYNSESSVRALLNESTAAHKSQGKVTADILRKELETKGMIDVGAGAEKELGCSQQTLKEALFILETEGYNVYGIGIPQVTNPGKQTITPVLTKKDISYGETYKNMGDIQSVGDYHSIDGGNSYTKVEYPSSINSSRVSINYGDEGGSAKDGVIEIRRGVKDLDLGNSHYAQVRILVDGDHYLKGMAIYADDLPEGKDIRFNTNKKSGTPIEKVMKPIKDDPDNPFGAYIKANGQSYYDDPNGKFINPETGNKASLNAVNKIKEEGDWDSMSKNLSSQFLSKQPMKLIKQQLTLTYDDAVSDYEDICNLTNPTVKKKMLLDFADECDSAVVHLKAAALPRQSTQVILPLTGISDKEVYAPNYKNGEQVALVRYPHAGTFEIPVLTVNNKNKQGKDILGNVNDAVGINPKTAERLSGADFDGDQVVVIPISNKVKIKSTPALKGLKDFDPKTEYAIPEGNPNHVKLMTKAQTQKQMGMVSNLITDMTLAGGATESEFERAVKHSMVVIDDEKHKLDYKKSERDNGIEELKQKYQKHINDEGYGGAATLLSRRKQDVRIPERQGSGIIDPETGKISYKESGRTYKDKNGNTVLATQKVKLLNETEDIFTLSSGTPQENAYADYANKMKALANDARKEYKATGSIKYSPSAKEAYQKEVDHLNAQLNIALRNAPKERRAQAIANSQVKAKIQENPGMDKKDIRKASQLAINNARIAVGASGKESRIQISDKEWEAIQAGAITDTKLAQILRYADPDRVKELATPRMTTELSQAKKNKIKSMAASGHTNAEIAEAIGRSASVVSKYLSGKEGE